VAYQLGDCLLVKCFQWIEGATYPDGGVNFETFSNEQMLEVETLGPLVTLKPASRRSTSKSGGCSRASTHPHRGGRGPVAEEEGLSAVSRTLSDRHLAGHSLSLTPPFRRLWERP